MSLVGHFVKTFIPYEIYIDYYLYIIIYFILILAIKRNIRNSKSNIFFISIRIDSTNTFCNKIFKIIRKF